MRRPYLVALVAFSCREPTYVSVHLTTDVPCERVQGVTVTVGTLGALEDKVPVTRAATCSGNEIGTISLVPTAGNEDELGIRVVMGIGRDVESCTAPAYGDGCVVARRGLHYLAHQALTLPIVMRQICNGIPCGPYETCIKGVCKSAKIDDPSKCTTPDGCGEDTFVDVIGDAGAGTDGAAASTTQLAAFCGSPTKVDLAASWPMRGGCQTHANRTRFSGPATKPTKVTTFDVTSDWYSLAMSGTRGWGARRDAMTGSITAQPIDLVNDTPQTQNGGVSTAKGSCILVTGGKVVCAGGTQIEDLSFTSTNGLGGTTRSLLAIDGGASDLAEGWAYGTDDTAWVFQHGVGGADEVVGLPPGGGPERARTPMVGALVGWPALSVDGSVLYAMSTLEGIIAFDTQNGAKKWNIQQNAYALAGSGSGDAFLVSAVQQGAQYQIVLRGYGSATGQLVISDIPLGVIDSLPSWSPGWDIAVGDTDTTTNFVIVLEPGVVVAVEANQSKTVWTHPASQRATMIWSLSNRIYLAGDKTVTAIDASNGRDIWTTDPGSWNTIYALAIGGDDALYVAADTGIHRFAQ